MKMGKAVIAVLALALSLSGTAHGQAVEKKQVTFAVGGKTALYYLPLTICERLGYFKEQGLEVTINDFRGGAQSLQALVGGSVDVVTGAYEHTIRMQAKGQDIRAVIELGRFPGIVVGVRKEKAASYKSAADLKGMKIGVSAPGSSTNFFVMYLMSKAGLKPADASYIGVGALRQAGFHRQESGNRAGAGQRLLQDVAVAGQGDARGDRRDGAGGLFSRRQSALRRRSQGQQAGLFPHRRHSACRHEIGRRHAPRLRRRAQECQGRPREDLRRPLRRQGRGA